MNASQYFIKAKIIARHLANVGELVNEKDLLLYIFDGLGAKYKKIIMFNIQMRDIQPSINFMHNYLEGYDRMLQRSLIKILDFKQILQNFQLRVNSLSQTMVKIFLVILVHNVGV